MLAPGLLSQDCCPRAAVPGLLSRQVAATNIVTTPPPGSPGRRAVISTAVALHRHRAHVARQPQPEDQTGGQATGAALSHWLAPRPELTIKASTPSATSHHPADGEQGGGMLWTTAAGSGAHWRAGDQRRRVITTSRGRGGPAHRKRPGRRRSRHAQSSRATLSTGRGVRRTAQPASTIRDGLRVRGRPRRPGTGC